MVEKPGLLREFCKRMGGRGPETARSCIRRAPDSLTPLGYRDAASAGPLLPTSRESELPHPPEAAGTSCPDAPVHIPRCGNAHAQR